MHGVVGLDMDDTSTAVPGMRPRSFPTVPDKRKPLECEYALQWAYREQLPKVEHSKRWTTRMQSLESLGTMVDESSIDVGFPVSDGEPHADAALIGAAVDRLEEFRLDWPNFRVLIMPDLIHWATAYDPGPNDLIFQPAQLLKAHARMATRPQWHVGQPRVLRVLSKNGKDPLLQYIDYDGNLVEGRTSARHYGRMARCVCQLYPAVKEIAYARSQYFVWRSALADVATTLRAWKLRDHVVTSPVAAAEPWIVDTEIRSRILRSNR